MIVDQRYAPRAIKSNKIISVLHDFAGSDLSNKYGLDIGCANGDITYRLAPHFNFILGIDINTSTIQEAQYSRKEMNMAFSIASCFKIPLAACSIDIVICAQVYEHTTKPEILAQECWRILRPGGICFLSGPNRLAYMEEHYWLPFLSLLPKSLADFYMRIFKRGKHYDVYPLFYWQLRKIFNIFIIHDYTTYVLLAHTNLSHKINSFPYWGKIMPVWFINLFTPIYPNYNWILEKPL